MNEAAKTGAGIILRSVATILLALALTYIGIHVFRDPIARRFTHYAPGFSDAGFSSIRAGDSQERVIRVLGQPMARYYLLEWADHSYRTHPVVPPDQFPTGMSLYRDVLQYSSRAQSHLPFRRVEVMLTSDANVADTTTLISD